MGLTVIAAPRSVVAPSSAATSAMNRERGLSAIAGRWRWWRWRLVRRVVVLVVVLVGGGAVVVSSLPLLPGCSLYIIRAAVIVAPAPTLVVCVKRGAILVST
jgi:hypothetical protein